MSHILSRICYQNRNTIQKIMSVFSAHNFFSTVTPYTTPENHPGKHTVNDLGLIYTIKNDLAFDILYKNGIVKISYLEECETFGETPFLIRKPALEIINCLKNTNYNNPVNKYLLYGEWGSGKSMTMAQVIYYAHMSDWLIVDVPGILSWIRTKNEVTESNTMDGYMDIPTDASAWLTHFKIQNQNLLKKLDLRIENDYKWNIREENKQGEPVLNLVDHGINRPLYACDVVNALFEEVKLLSKSGKVKTLVAINRYSLIFSGKTTIRGRDKKFVKPSKVSVISGLKNITAGDWHNGAIILSCFSPKDCPNGNEYLPLNQLTLEGFEFLNPFIPIEVPPLTDKEMTSVLKYYKSKNWIPDVNGEKELKILCAGNHLALRYLCGPL